MTSQAFSARLLGYKDNTQYTRGDRWALYREIEQHVQASVGLDPVRLTNTFLNNCNAGSWYFGRTGLTITERWPVWEIKEERERLSEKEIARLKKLLRCDNPPPTPRPLIQDVSDGRTAVTAGSMRDMIMKLQSWMAQNPNGILPGSRKFYRGAVEKGFAKETIWPAEPGKIAWIFRMQVSPEEAVSLEEVRQISILRRSDGTSLFVKTLKHKGDCITHCAWTGGQGFTTSAVAVSYGPVLSTRAFRTKVNGHLSKAFGSDSTTIRSMIEIAQGSRDILEIPDIDTSDATSSDESSVSIREKPNLRRRNQNLRYEEYYESISSDSSSDGSLTAENPNSLEEAGFPNCPEGIRKSHGTNHESVTEPVAAPNASAQQSAQIPCDSEHDTVQEPQSLVDILRQDTHPKRCRTSLSSSSSSLSEISKRPRLDSSNDPNKATSRVMHGDAFCLEFTNDDIPQSQQSPQPHPFRQDLSSSRINRSTPCSLPDRAATTNTRFNEVEATSKPVNTHGPAVPRELRSPPPCVPTEQCQSPMIQRLVRFRFFHRNEVHGALCKTLRDCSKMAKFFDFAGRPPCFGPNEAQPYGVSVTFPDKPYPTLVEWRDEEGFEEMMEEICREVRKRGDRLEVEIRVVDG
ncbi:MAG: hypothetical protein Q9219_006320 [cf. Caloplaca sp. 3 TL-2023]